MFELYPQNIAGTYPEGSGGICKSFVFKWQTVQNMPGLIMLGVDVDDDTTTGGSSFMASLITTCASGLPSPSGKIKPNQAGIDVNIFFYLRDQVDAPSAYGYDCLGPPTGGSCMTRGPECTCTDPATGCYLVDTSCTPGDADCYVRGDVCRDNGDDCTIGEELCSDMTEDCVRDEPCNVQKIRGEWIANPFGGGGGQNANPVERGRIVMPLPPGPDDPENSFCFKFPWKMIIEGVALASTDSPPPDYTQAIDPANVKWEVSTWYRIFPIHLLLTI